MKIFAGRYIDSHCNLFRVLYILKKMNKLLTAEEICRNLDTIPYRSIQSKMARWTEKRIIQRRYRPRTPVYEYWLDERGLRLLSRVGPQSISVFNKEFDEAQNDLRNSRMVLQSRLNQMGFRLPGNSDNAGD